MSARGWMTLRGVSDAVPEVSDDYLEHHRTPPSGSSIPSLRVSDDASQGVRCPLTEWRVMSETVIDDTFRGHT